MSSFPSLQHPPNAVAYVRVSTQEQSQREALECQKRAIEAYAKCLALRPILFEEVGSAYKQPIEKRPEAMAALKKAQELGVPLIVDTPDRLSRNEGDLETLNSRHNVQIIAAREGDQPPEVLAARIARAEAESQHKSDGLKRLYQERKATGLGPLNPDLDSARRKGHETSRRKALARAHELDELVRSMNLEHLSAYKLEKVLAEQGFLRSDGGKWSEEVITSSRNRLNAEQEPQPAEAPPPATNESGPSTEDEEELELLARMSDPEWGTY